MQWNMVIFFMTHREVYNFNSNLLLYKSFLLPTQTPKTKLEKWYFSFQLIFRLNCIISK